MAQLVMGFMMMLLLSSDTYLIHASSSLADVMTCSLAITDQNRCGGGNCSSSTCVPLLSLKLKP